VSYPPNPDFPHGPQPGYGQPGYGGQPGAPGYGPPPNIGDWLATWGTRAGAALIDGLISLVIAAPFVGIGIAADLPILVVLGYIAGFAWAIYQMHQQGTTGATIGKKQMGIRIVRESDGQPTGFGMAVLRYLAHILDSLPCYLGFLWPLWDEKKQTFADKICGTLAIKSQ
jgi:uncharacterized RDD family membrane protein YckC